MTRKRLQNIYLLMTSGMVYESLSYENIRFCRVHLDEQEELSWAMEEVMRIFWNHMTSWD